jgi:hypothetical protein
MEASTVRRVCVRARVVGLRGKGDLACISIATDETWARGRSAAPTSAPAAERLPSRRSAAPAAVEHRKKRNSRWGCCVWFVFWAVRNQRESQAREVKHSTLFF